MGDLSSLLPTYHCIVNEDEDLDNESSEMGKETPLFDVLPENQVLSTQELIVKKLSDAMAGCSVSSRQLSERMHEIGIKQIFNCILPWFVQPTLKDEDIHFLLEVMDKTLHNSDEDQLQPFVPEIINAAQLFLDDDSHHCLKAHDIIYNLSKIVGPNAMLAVIEEQMNDDTKYAEDLVIRTTGIVASALGISVVLPLITTYCQCNVPWRVRCTSIRIMEQIVIQTGCKLQTHLQTCMEILQPGLVDSDLEVVRATVLCLARLAKAVAPHGYENFKSVMEPFFTLPLPGMGDMNIVPLNMPKIVPGNVFLSGLEISKSLQSNVGMLIALLKLCASIIFLIDPCVEDRSTSDKWCLRIKTLARHLLREKGDDQQVKEIILETTKELAEAKCFVYSEFHGVYYRNLVSFVRKRTTRSREDYMFHCGKDDASIAFAKMFNDWMISIKGRRNVVRDH